MSNPQRGLGRGLNALFGDADVRPNATVPPATTLPLEKIVPNPSQPRRHFSKEALEELAASIRSQGIIQPLLVRPRQGTDRYEIVAGERRWRAAGLAGLTSVPVFVRSISDEDVMLAALIENLQREDLNPIEEALALQALREQCNLTQEEMATRLGKSRSAIANTLRLLSLSLAAQDDLQFGRMNAGHARALLGIQDETAQEALRQAIVDKKLTVREAEVAANAWKAGKPFPWATGEAPLSAENADAAPPVRANKAPVLRSLQQELSTFFSVKASVSGNAQRGRITLSYGSPQELAQVLHKLGIPAPAAPDMPDAPTAPTEADAPDAENAPTPQQDAS